MNDMYATGADKSPFDVRTFAYAPLNLPKFGGTKYNKADIENQYKVGICTAISLTQNARKATGIKYSADFQYLLQKKYIDGNWNEGSSISSALKVASKYGLLPDTEWSFTSIKDRKLGYEHYVEKLKSITDKEIAKLLKKAAKYKIKAYARVPVDMELMAQAINDSQSGILARYDIGNEWWREPIEPLRKPKDIISGHAVTDSNYNGSSFRIANTWGPDWASGGTAYRLHAEYKPTEAWIVYYDIVPDDIQKQLENRTKLVGKLKDLVQLLIEQVRILNNDKKDNQI